MKLFKSIKWRLQLWYGLILVVVLTGFGSTAYVLESNRQFRKLDEELHNRIGVIGNSLRRQQPRGPSGNRPPRRQNPDEPPFDGPQPGQFPNDDPQGRNALPPFRFSLLPEDAHFFDAAEPFGYYFRIQTRDGNELARSTNAPDFNSVNEGQRRPEKINPKPVTLSLNVDDGEIRPDAHGGSSRSPLGRVAPAWMRGSLREIQVETPAGDIILVGKNISPELKELRRVAYILTGVGLAILALGLTGGWWLVSRSLRPVSDISSAAAKISAGDLSQRIDVDEAESELGQLATVLNSTFARLETAFAQQKQFASDAAHELRTPVSVMLTQTQTALNRERDAAGYKQTVEACQRAAQRMRKLIESLLALARFDAGQERLQRQPLDLAQTVRDCVEMIQPLAEQSGVTINFAATPCVLNGDAGRLAQVVTNLLTNAIQYNRTEGEVQVTLESQNGLAVLTVADTGQGISEDHLPRLFGRFFRADASRTGASNAGLGLAITKAIVEAHGGSIEVASTEDVGTTFTIRLPLG